MDRSREESFERSEEVSSPDWHGEVLSERIAAVQEGRTEFVDWEEAKQRLHDRFGSTSAEFVE